MKALVYQGPRQLTLEDVEPIRPGPDEVLLKVISAGICGSELEGYLGESSLRKPPLIMGHEFSGEVIAVGSGVANGETTTVGRRVVVNPLVGCGECRLCRQDRSYLCPKRILIGAGRPGAFAEYVTVPAHQLINIPDNGDPVLAAMAEPLATALHGARLANTGREDGVVVWGAGTIGLMSVFAAHVAGAGPIIVLDTNRERLTAGRQLGATYTLDATSPDIQSEIREIVGDRPIVTVDAVGRSRTRQAAMEAAMPAGRVVLLGLADRDTSFNVQAAIRGEVSLLGSYAYSHRELEEAVGLLASLGKRAGPWISIRSLLDGPAAFHELIETPGSIAKVLLTP